MAIPNMGFNLVDVEGVWWSLAICELMGEIGSGGCETTCGVSGFGIGEVVLSAFDVLQRFGFFLQMGFTLILATLDGLDVGLLGDVIGGDDCLLKIVSKPINAYFKNNRVVYRDYLKVTKEHITILNELLEEARALKPLDEHIGHASKFAVQIQELLVYVSASCPFTQRENEKWALATSHKKNNKPYVDASRTKQTIKTITQKHVVKQNTQKTDNTMLPSTGRVSSTNASGSKTRSNTKNDRIPQPSSKSMKNKVESHHRKFKSSTNKNNHVSDCNVNVKNVALSNNSDTICLSCNKCLFSANYDACVVQYLKKRQKHKVAKSAKQKVKREWKPT
ncbi:hypothetical protein Tco_0749141 [Tanacetum coccineum]|uniref:Uncharacterized protein n=1 Tax=Tanacetum coccineum TaxID=301880 RepID=A0ABQ4Z0E5_9ASTR